MSGGQRVDVLAGLAMDAGRAYQENVRLYGEAKAKQMHDESNARIAAVAKLIDAATKLAGNEFIFSTGTAWVDAKNLRAALANIGPQP